MVVVESSIETNDIFRYIRNIIFNRLEAFCCD